jgi:hypothetical protein
LGYTKFQTGPVFRGKLKKSRISSKVGYVGIVANETSGMLKIPKRVPYEVRDPYRSLPLSVDAKMGVLTLSIIMAAGLGWIVHELGHFITAAFLGEHLVWTSPVSCYFYPTSELNRYLIAIGGNVASLITGILFILPILVVQIKDERIKIFLAGFGGFNLFVFLVNVMIDYWR